MRRWITVFVLAFAACTTLDPRPTWNADVSREQFMRDNYECTRDSRTQPSPGPVIIGGGPGVFVDTSGLRAREKSEELHAMCMESKGYVQQCPPGTSLHPERYKCKPDN